MKIFDLHADLACAFEQHKSETAVLRNHWAKDFEQGQIGYTAAASFFAGDESCEEMVNTVNMVEKALSDGGYQKIMNVEDLDRSYDETCFLMTVEGMCGIHDNVEEKINWLYEKGNRIGSLCWNDQNDLATGNSGDPSRGLTDMGKAAVRKMNELHFIIDVSHANEKTFWDILETSSQPIIATHSNAKRSHKTNHSSHGCRNRRSRNSLLGSYDRNRYRSFRPDFVSLGNLLYNRKQAIDDMACSSEESEHIRYNRCQNSDMLRIFSQNTFSNGNQKIKSATGLQG